MRRFALLPALLLLAALPATAQEACDPVQRLFLSGTEPQLKVVAPGKDRVHFIKDATQQASCPNDSNACAMKGYVVPGDSVVMMGQDAGYACAAYTGKSPKFAASSGFLPADTLVNGPAAADADWLGAWRSGDEQEIDIKTGKGGALTVEGNATWGGHDPARVANGGINAGQFRVILTPQGTKAAFSLGDSASSLDDDYGQAEPYDKDKDDDTICRIRLWRLGPYLVAADNMDCGGQNVTFTGVYARAGKAP